MARIKLSLPEKFHFSTIIAVRITDLNYGNHVGNDSVLSIIHEARMQFLIHQGHTELSFAGVGLIMSDVAIEFKHELYYGDQIIASVAVGEQSKVGFELLYLLEKEAGGKRVTCAIARTGMISYDYEKKKIAPLPENPFRL